MGKPYKVAEYVYIQSIGFIPYERVEELQSDGTMAVKYRTRAQVLFEILDVDRNRIGNVMDDVVLLEKTDAPPTFAELQDALTVTLPTEVRNRLKQKRLEIAGYVWNG